MKKYSLLLLLLVGCTSPSQRTETLPEVPEGPEVITYPAPKTRINTPQVDYISLQKNLGIDRDVQDLGYSEKAFNTCEGGAGFSHSEDCHQEYFVLIHMQLLCRETEGTVQNELTSADMVPLSNKTVKWSLGTKAGEIPTDSDGRGQIRMSFPVRVGTQRLKIGIDQQFLHLEADEISRIVTPGSWCHR
jgi:hypothetical protein